MSTGHRYTLDIEAVSCDEMYVELGPILRATNLSADDFVTHLRREIQTLTGCPCSAGLGSNRLQARMATKKAKPNGQFHLQPEAVSAYFADIELSAMPGVGYSMQQKLGQLGWLRCSDLFDVPVGRVQSELGRKVGETLHQQCRGIDARPLTYGQQRKSVSAEVNYGIRFAVDAEFEAFLRQLCAEVHSRLTEIRQRGKSVTLKLMVRAADAPVETAKFMGHGVCDTVSKTSTLPQCTDDAEMIVRTVMAIRRQLKVAPPEVRGVGIQIAKLEPVGGGNNTSLNGRLRSMFAQAKPKQTKPNEAVAQKEQTAVKPSTITVDKPAPKRALRSNRAMSLDVPVTIAKRTAKKKTKSNPIQEMVENHVARVEETTSAGDDELDLAVLAELPADIRDEAVRNFRAEIRKKQQSLPVPKTKPVQEQEQPDTDLDSEFLQALPEDIRREVLANEKRERLRLQMRRSADATVVKTSPMKTSTDLVANDVAVVHSPSQISPDNVLLASNWRTMLQQWIDTIDANDSDLEPSQSDIAMIAENCVELIRGRKLVDLYERLRFIFR